MRWKFVLGHQKVAENTTQLPYEYLETIASMTE